MIHKKKIEKSNVNNLINNRINGNDIYYTNKM